MPTSIATAVVLVLAIVPGAFGLFAFGCINGSDWREKEWEAAIRALAFSALGLLTYSLLALWFDLIPPLHVVPGSYDAASLKAENISRLLLPYPGHLASAGVVGFVAALLYRAVSKVRRSSHHVCAWDDFVETSLSGRWVVVTLKTGDSYAGFVRTADVGVSAGERDLVLREPARWEDPTSGYIVTPYYELFLRADLVQSIASLSMESETHLGGVSGERLFKEDTHVKENSSPASESP